MKRIRTAYIIHGFALLHAAVTALCLVGGIQDTLLLTLLTMTMSVLICLKYTLSVEATAIVIIAVNVTGFGLGNLGAAFFEWLHIGELAARPLATFATTEIMGWAQALVGRNFRRVRRAAPQEAHPASWTGRIGYLVFAVVAVFVLRMAVEILFSHSRNEDADVVMVLAQVSVYVVVFMVGLAVVSRNESVREQEKTHQAEFRYMVLKQQVNPHFLFNSLNILDGLVQEGSMEDASRYIHRMAGLYRYMLQHEGESLVRLSEEAEFARMYEELLHVRFPRGFAVETGLREEDLQRFVVPCALQLLIENATKHNAISAERPLVIRITSDGHGLTVSNNIVPRLSPPNSTGLGMKYIREQYADLSRKGISVETGPDTFAVKLPLL